jgi:hypothetical protein
LNKNIKENPEEVFPLLLRVLLALFTCSVGAYTVGTIEATLSPFLDTLGIQVRLFQQKYRFGPQSSELTGGPPEFVQHFRL